MLMNISNIGEMNMRYWMLVLSFLIVISISYASLPRGYTVSGRDLLRLPCQSPYLCQGSSITPAYFVLMTNNADTPENATVDIFLYHYNYSSMQKIGIPNAAIFAKHYCTNGSVSICRLITDDYGASKYFFGPNRCSNCSSVLFTFCSGDPNDPNTTSSCLGIDDPSTIHACNTPDGYSYPTTVNNYSQFFSIGQQVSICKAGGFGITAVQCFPALVILALLMTAMFMTGYNPLNMFGVRPPKPPKGARYQVRPQSVSFTMSAITGKIAGALAGAAADATGLSGENVGGAGAQPVTVGALTNLKIGKKFAKTLVKVNKVTNFVKQVRMTVQYLPAKIAVGAVGETLGNTVGRIHLGVGRVITNLGTGIVSRALTGFSKKDLDKMGNLGALMAAWPFRESVGKGGGNVNINRQQSEMNMRNAMLGMNAIGIGDMQSYVTATTSFSDDLKTAGALIWQQVVMAVMNKYTGGSFSALVYSFGFLQENVMNKFIMAMYKKIVNMSEYRKLDDDEKDLVKEVLAKKGEFKIEGVESIDRSDPYNAKITVKINGKTYVINEKDIPALQRVLGKMLNHIKKGFTNKADKRLFENIEGNVLSQFGQLMQLIVIDKMKGYSKLANEELINDKKLSRYKELFNRRGNLSEKEFKEYLKLRKHFLDKLASIGINLNSQFNNELLYSIGKSGVISLDTINEYYDSKKNQLITTSGMFAIAFTDMLWLQRMFYDKDVNKSSKEYNNLAKERSRLETERKEIERDRAALEKKKANAKTKEEHDEIETQLKELNKQYKNVNKRIEDIDVYLAQESERLQKAIQDAIKNNNLDGAIEGFKQYRALALTGNGEYSNYAMGNLHEFIVKEVSISLATSNAISYLTESGLNKAAVKLYQNTQDMFKTSLTKGTQALALTATESMDTGLLTIGSYYESAGKVYDLYSKAMLEPVMNISQYSGYNFNNRQTVDYELPSMIDGGAVEVKNSINEFDINGIVDYAKYNDLNNQYKEENERFKYASNIGDSQGAIDSSVKLSELDIQRKSIKNEHIEWFTPEGGIKTSELPQNKWYDEAKDDVNATVMPAATEIITDANEYYTTSINQWEKNAVKDTAPDNLFDWSQSRAEKAREMAENARKNYYDAKNNNEDTSKYLSDIETGYYQALNATNIMSTAMGISDELVMKSSSARKKNSGAMAFNAYADYSMNLGNELNSLSSGFKQTREIIGYRIAQAHDEYRSISSEIPKEQPYEELNKFDILGWLGRSILRPDKRKARKFNKQLEENNKRVDNITSWIKDEYVHKNMSNEGLDGLGKLTLSGVLEYKEINNLNDLINKRDPAVLKRLDGIGKNSDNKLILMLGKKYLSNPKDEVTGMMMDNFIKDIEESKKEQKLKEKWPTSSDSDEIARARAMRTNYRTRRYVKPDTKYKT